eukprot:4471714-Ditylum_brightwellii.AAC.1
MGKSVLAKWPKMAAKMIKVDTTGFTDTCWHRSGATTMADQGESAINLKYAGVNTSRLPKLELSKVQKSQILVPSLPKESEGGGEGDSASSEGDDYHKPAEWAVCRTVVINNYYVSPFKMEE